MDGRKEKRSAARLEVLLSNPAEPWLTEAVSTENICSSGMRVQTVRRWERGAIVHVKSPQDEHWARAKVVYCKPLPHPLHQKTFSLGLEFLPRTGP